MPISRELEMGSGLWVVIERGHSIGIGVKGIPKRME